MPTRKYTKRTTVGLEPVPTVDVGPVVEKGNGAAASPTSTARLIAAGWTTQDGVNFTSPDATNLSCWPVALMLANLPRAKHDMEAIKTIPTGGSNHYAKKDFAQLGASERKRRLKKDGRRP